MQLNCSVRGRIKKLRHLKNVAFAELDTTEDLQLVFDRDRFNETTFQQVKALKLDARIQANVSTEYDDKRQPPIRLIVHGFDPIPANPIAARRSQISHEQAQSKIDLASVTRSVATRLLETGWTEVAPLTISTNLSQTVAPLQVLFPGLGAETALVVNPVAQLVEVAQLTGTPSVFSISRIYSRSIRDGFTSPESIAIVTISLRKAEEREISLALAEELVRYGFQPVRSRLSSRERDWLTEQWERQKSNVVGALREVSSPVHQLAKEDKCIVFRSVWPHPIALVEGHVQELTDGTLHCMTLHCERILHLVSSVHYRRLQEDPVIGLV